MKNLKNILIVAMMITAFASCKKDEVLPSSGNTTTPPTTSHTFTGRWKGSWGYGSNNSTSYYSLNFKTNGVAEQINSANVVTGTGTWTLNGTDLTVNYHSVNDPSAIYTVDAVYDSTHMKIEGSWMYESNVIYQGSFVITKQ